jgi:hypothetical protein
LKHFAYTLERDRVEIPGSRLPPPVLTYRGDGRWRLEVAYTYADDETAIAVPVGFELDLASVPRVFWPLIAPFELSIVAPLVHDFLYRSGGKTATRTYMRAEADALFRRIMTAESVPKWRATLAYVAVRLFGRSAWRD